MQDINMVVSIKYSKVFVLAAIVSAAVFAGCSGGRDEPPQPQRPGEPVVPKPAATLFFVQPELFVDVTGGGTGSFGVELRRRGVWLPDTAYRLERSDARGALTLPESVSFGAGDTVATVAVSYSLSLNEGADYEALLAVRAAPESVPAIAKVFFRRPTAWEDAGGAIYRSGSGTVRTAVRVRRTQASDEYELRGEEGFLRRFTVFANGSVVPAAGAAGIEGYDSVCPAGEYGDVRLRARFPLCGVPSACHDAGKYYSLIMVYTSGSVAVPRYDVVRMDGAADADWMPVPDAVFTDGWLTGVVSFEARPPLEPSEHPWPVEAACRRDGKVLRLYGLYRVASPLSPLNACPELVPLDISIDWEDGTAEVAPQYSGFDYPGMFSQRFTIGGTGTFLRDADGSLTITLPLPLHNGYGAYGDTWASQWPCVVTIRTQE